MNKIITSILIAYGAIAVTFASSTPVKAFGQECVTSSGELGRTGLLGFCRTKAERQRFFQAGQALQKLDGSYGTQMPRTWVIHQNGVTYHCRETLPNQVTCW